MVSIKDISIKCGVSVATVSKALNNQSDVSDKTKNVIVKAAKEMGYLPNSHARALKTNKTYNIGVLFIDEAQSGLTHNYFAQVLDSFKVEAECNGYDITFINKNIGGVKMSYLEHCKYRDIDGVVIACVNFLDPDVVELVNGDIPVVTIDHLFNNKTAIISDNITGMRDLVNYVYSKGHRKIAYIHGNKSSVNENRLASFYKTTEELGIDVPDCYVCDGIYHDPISTKKFTAELLKLKDRPTCILFPDDFSAIGGIIAIEDAGLSIPNDISVVGYDGIYLSQVINPKLTTLEQDTKSIGKQAAVQLVQLIEKPKTTLAEQIIIPGRLIEGNSVKTLNQF